MSHDFNVVGFISSGKSEDTMIFMDLKALNGVIGHEAGNNDVELSIPGTKNILEQKLQIKNDY